MYIYIYMYICFYIFCFGNCLTVSSSVCDDLLLFLFNGKVLLHHALKTQGYLNKVAKILV